MIEKVLDGVDLAIDFATLGEYGLIPAGSDERLMRATGAMPLADVISLDSRRKVAEPAPAVVRPVPRVAPMTAAGVRLALSPCAEGGLPPEDAGRPAIAPAVEASAAECPGADRRRQAPAAKERALSPSHAGRRRGTASKAPIANQLALELSA